MGKGTLEATRKLYFTDARMQLERAAAIAKAADVCARAGNIDNAIEICLDVEQPIFDVTTLLNAASPMNRMCMT